MKNKINYIILSILFLIVGTPVFAQKWEEVKQNTTKKTLEYSSGRVNRAKIDRLTQIMKQDGKVITEQSTKILQLNQAIEHGAEAYKDKVRQIKIQKGYLAKAQAADPHSSKSKSIRRRLNELTAKKESLKNSLKKNASKRKSFTSSLNKLKNKLLKNKNTLTLLSGAGKVIDYTDAVEAGGGTLGEISAWWEGSSSFKNVVVRAVKEGGKATVSIGTGIMVGSSTLVSTWNPFLAGAAVVTSTIAAEEVYEATTGKYLEGVMNREYTALINEKYKPDPEQLFKRREALRKKAFEEKKKLLKNVASKQDEYNKELEDYINERNQLWAAFEEEMQKQAEEELKLKTAENPSVVQKASKKKIKPGETVTISIETKGGLLPIKYSGVLDYTVNTGYDRYLVSYKWTPDKKMEPGVYEFSIKATSASKKVGSHTVAIEVIDPNPAPEPIAKPTKNYDTDTDGERIYKASELNIKEIPGAEIRKMIYKVNGIYYGHCETPADIKTQKFDIQLGVDPYKLESKFGIAKLEQFFGNKTIPLSAESIQRIKEKTKLPDDLIPKTSKIYFHLHGNRTERDQATGDKYLKGYHLKFDPVSGRIWGKLEGESSVYHDFIVSADFMGSLEAKLANGLITGTITFTMGKNDYSFPFTAKQ